MLIELTNEERAGTLWAIAIELLQHAGMDVAEPDITLLADDLAKVHYNPVIDGAYRASSSILDLFWSRIGGRLRSYMQVIRPNSKGAK
jgi:hypothetical protein